MSRRGLFGRINILVSLLFPPAGEWIRLRDYFNRKFTKHKEIISLTGLLSSRGKWILGIMISGIFYGGIDLRHPDWVVLKYQHFKE
jgi:hypothetical protein